MNTALLSRVARVASHEHVHSPLVGDMLCLNSSDYYKRVDIQIYGGPGKPVLGSLITWTRILDDSTVDLVHSREQVIVEVYGNLDGDQVRVTCHFHGAIADALRHRAVWDGDRTTSSIHHLRAVQGDAYRVAVAA